MDEVKLFGEVVQSVGIPALFFLLFAYAFFKLIPEWLKVWRENREAEIKREDKAAEELQKYYDERNKSYTAQLELMNRQAEQQNQLIGQSTQVTAIIMSGATLIAYIIGEGLTDAASAGKGGGDENN